MSEENLEIVKRWVRAFNLRDMDALLDTTTTDFEFTPYLANLIETTTYQGHDGLASTSWMLTRLGRESR